MGVFRSDFSGRRLGKITLNFIHETKAHDTEARLEVVTSQIEKMADIVAEQWIQIQQLEQALQITEMQILKVKRQGGSTRCTFVKFIKNLLSNHLETSRLMVDPYLSDKGFPLSSYLPRTLHQLAKTFSAAQHYHHELQGYIKQEMERNEFTVDFANREVASALVLFPILSAWMCLVSQVS
ncbi:hypothetical protein RJ639_021689 [Escallonia herrerae]|uniref:Uncharacterized protein n=1 Tax=Escallonia herrerae TaxID=1293975 RepID=A0AA89AFR4_9ASTE|nr:hypothetical protein RJ639_021689 [Escallonia herrerae]